jgi:endonuclease/exonuclease/phosphatase (EEP) superfamily protein YafD
VSPGGLPLRALRKLWRARLAWLLGTATLAPAGVVLAAWLGDVHPKIDVIGHFLLPALWLAAVTALLALPLRAPWLFMMAAATFSAGVVRVTGLTALQDQTRPALATLSVLQFNKWRDNPSPEAVDALVRARDPDLLVLIEARHGDHELLADKYPYVLAESRWELRPSHIRVLSRYPLTLQGFGRGLLGESRMIVDVETPAGPVRVVPFHFTRPWPFAYPDLQGTQAQSLAALVGQPATPLVLLGDCNCVPWGATARTLERSLGLSGFKARFHGTWPARVQSNRPDRGAWPRALGIPIDLVFASPDLRITGLEVLDDSAGSDHRPVSFNLAILPPAPNPVR